MDREIILEKIRNVKGLNFNKGKIVVNLNCKKYDIVLKTTFNVKKYGYNKAFELALEKRKEYEKMLYNIRKDDFYNKPILKEIKKALKNSSEDNTPLEGVYKFKNYFVAGVRIKGKVLEIPFPIKIFGEKNALTLANLERQRMISYKNNNISDEYISIKNKCNEFILEDKLYLNNKKYTIVEKDNILYLRNKPIRLELRRENKSFTRSNLYLINEETDEAFLVVRYLDRNIIVKFNACHLEKVKKRFWIGVKELNYLKTPSLKIKARGKYSQINLFDYVFEKNIIKFISYDYESDYIDLTKNGVDDYVKELNESDKYIYTRPDHVHFQIKNLMKTYTFSINCYGIERARELAKDTRAYVFKRELKKIV